MKKEFINLFPVLYWHERSKYNPLRYICGKRYLSKKIPHNLFDTKDIEIIPTENSPEYKVTLLKKYHEKTLTPDL